MKLVLAGLVLAALAGGWASEATAQDARIATLIAERDQAEERSKRLSAALEDLKEAQAEQNRRLLALDAEIQRLREQLAQLEARLATQEDLTKLADKIKEVDDKRQADNARILETLEKFVKSPTPKPAAPGASPGARASREKGYWYEIKDGDTLSAIAKAYRDQGVKVTVEAIQEANPKVDPRSLRIRQKIWIPEPAD